MAQNQVFVDNVEFYELKRIKTPIAYAMSANIQDACISRTLIYDVEKGVHEVLLSIGEVAEYLTALNDEKKNLHYLRVGRWYVVNADSVLYVCPQDKTLILAYSDLSYNHILIKDIPAAALRKLREELHESPQPQKVILGNEDQEFWLYPDEILYAKTKVGKKQTTVFCMNGQEYIVPLRIGQVHMQLNRLKNNSHLENRTSKRCIVSLGRIDMFHTSPHALALLDAKGYYHYVTGLSKEAYRKYFTDYVDSLPKTEGLTHNFIMMPKYPLSQAPIFRGRYLDIIDFSAV